MAVDHTAVQLALRARLRTLAAVTTGSVTLAATATGYSRLTGSFLTDGFAAGMEVTPGGFTQTAVGVITSVSALAMTISGGRTVESSGAGRSLSVGLPSLVAWDNQAITPVAGQPYGEEEYVPGPSRALTMPTADATMEDTGLYVFRWYSKAGAGLPALRKPADAILTLFKAGTALQVASNVVVRVRADVAPYAGPVRSLGIDWSVVVITIPWRLSYLNT